MKELSIEEKAKRFDMALENAKYYHSEMGDAVCCVLEECFPELKESEDEKIRKMLIHHIMQERGSLTNNEAKDALAWLEKQSAIDNCPFEYSTNTVMTDSKKNQIKPKFKVDDWVLYRGDHYGSVRHITKIDENGYYIERNGLPHGIIPFNHEICMRLWTIQDAKDGDVLATPNYIYIFNSIDKETETVSFYCLMKKSDEHFSFGDYKIFDEILNSTPATQEQRDLLFKKMKEGGYEWDAEKKELKKINSYCQENCKGFQETGKCFADGECKAKREAEHKSAWSEEDEAKLKSACALIRNTSLNGNEGIEDFTIDWLKSLKDRVQLQSKQEWSEEDESTIKDIIEDLEYAEAKGYVLKNNIFLKEINWLKSIKDRNLYLDIKLFKHY